MATVKGTLISDMSRGNTASTPGSAIPNVPIVLQDTISGLTLAVLTSNDGSGNGNYIFNEVPPGSACYKSSRPGVHVLLLFYAAAGFSSYPSGLVILLNPYATLTYSVSGLPVIDTVGVGFRIM